MLEHTKKPPTDRAELHLFIPVSKKVEILAYVRSMGGEVIDPDDLDVKEIPIDALHWTETGAFPELDGEENVPGMTLTEARKRYKIKQVELSDKTNIPQPHLSQMERGKRVIGKRNAKKLAKVFGVDYRVFL